MKSFITSQFLKFAKTLAVFGVLLLLVFVVQTTYAQTTAVQDCTGGTLTKAVLSGSTVSLCWSTDNPPPDTHASCTPNPSSGSGPGSFSGILRANGTAFTDAITAPTRFSLECLDQTDPTVPHFFPLAVTINIISGTLSCTANSASQITLPWTQTNGTNVSVFRGSTLVQTVSGASGSVADTGLSSGTSYTYYLRNGNTTGSAQLATATCTTSTPQPPTVTISAGNTLSGYTIPTVAYNTKPNIKWTSTNTTSCTAVTSSLFSTTYNGTANATNNPVGNTALVSQTTTPVTYTIRCTGPGGTTPDTSVVVNTLPQQPAFGTITTSCANPGNSDGSITVPWGAATLATGYKLHRSLTDADLSYSQLTLSSSDVTNRSFNNTSLSAGVYYYQVEAVGAAGSSYSVRPQQVTVPTCFDYSLTPKPADITVMAGNTGFNTVTKTRNSLSNSTSPVTLNVTGLPTGATYTLTNDPSSPTIAGSLSTLTITTSSNTPVATSLITVTGTATGLPNKTTTFNLIVTAVPPAPTVDLYVTYNTIDYLKGVKNGTIPVAYSSTPTLKWTSQNNPTTCTGTNFSTATALNNTTGVQVGPLTSTPITYSISCSNSYGTDIDTVTVTVLPQPPASLTLTPSASCASSGSSVNVTASWLASTLATSYKIHRSPSDADGSYGQLPIGAPTTVTSPYKDENLLAGTYYYQVEAVGANGLSSFSTRPKSIVIPPCFGYSLTNSGPISVLAGDSGSNVITKTLISGTTENITLTASGLPAGATYTFTNNPSTTALGNTLTITTTANTVADTYPITVTGSPLNKTTTFDLTVTAPQVITATISASPNPVPYNTQPDITWTSTNATSGCVATSANFSTSFNGTTNAANGHNLATNKQTVTTTYSVTCSGATGTTPVKKSVDVTVLPQAPTVKATTGSCGGNINLTYEDGLTGTSFTLYRQIDSDTTPYNNLNPTETQAVLGSLRATDSGLISGRTYFYQVSATNSNGTSYSTRPVSAVASDACVIPFDYSLTNSGPISIQAGGSSGSNNVTATRDAGTAQAVTLALTSSPTLPAGKVSCAISNTAVTPTDTRTVTCSATADTTAGAYTITVSGSPTDPTPTDNSTSFTLTVSVTPPNPTASISATPNPVVYGGTPVITWSSSGATTCTGTNFSTGNALSGTASGVAQTAPVTYKVTCPGATGTTPASASVTVNVLPQTPPSLTLTPSASCASSGNPVNINVSWGASTLATNYRLYRSDVGGTTDSYNPLTLSSTDLTNRTYKDEGYHSASFLPGTYWYQIEAVNAAGSSYLAPVSVVVKTCFDYSLTPKPADITVMAGASGFTTVTKTLNPLSDFTGAVTLNAVLPTGATLSPAITNNSGTASNPTSQSVLTIATASNLAVGTYPITVTGTATGLPNKTTSFNLIVTAVPPAPTVDLYVTYNTTEYLKGVENGTVPVAYSSTPILKWTSQNNPTTCTGTNFSTATALNNTTGVQVGPLTSTPITYSISCSNSYGTDIDTVTVTVSPQIPVLNTPTITSAGACAPIGGTAIVRNTWSNATLASTYKLHRSDDNGSNYGQLPIGAPTNVTSPYDDSRPAGTYFYQLEAIGANGLFSFSNPPISITVPPCLIPFDYSLTNSGPISIQAGGSSGSNNVTATRDAGTAQAVTLALTSSPTLPAGKVSCAISNTAVTPTDTRTVTCSATADTTAGTYTITVSGSPTDPTPTDNSTSFTLTVSVTIPNPTASISATPNPVVYGGTPVITWSSSGATTCTGTNFSTGNALSGTASGVAQTAPVTYKVTCPGATGTTPASASVTVNVLPQAPTVKATTGFCGGNINLTYEDGLTGTSFTLYRQIDSDTTPYSFVESKTILADLRATDSGLIPGRTYFYQVSATNSIGTSYSTRVSVVASAACAVISGTISCTADSTSQITLPWTQNNGTNVSIFRALTSTPTVQTFVQQVPSTSGSFVNTGLSSGTSYVYYLRNGYNPSSEQLATATCTTQTFLPDLRPHILPDVSASHPVFNGQSGNSFNSVSNSDFTLSAQPENISAGFTTDFKVQFQVKKHTESVYTKVVDASVTYDFPSGTSGSPAVQPAPLPTITSNAGGVAGDYDYRYCIDTSSAVSESNEDNNCSGDVRVIFGAVPTGSITACELYPVGNKMGIPWTQENASVNLSLFRALTSTPTVQTLVQALSGASGRVVDTGVTSGTSYTYYLRDGNTTGSMLLDSQVCATPKPDLLPRVDWPNNYPNAPIVTFKKTVNFQNGYNPTAVSTNDTSQIISGSAVTFKVSPQNTGASFTTPTTFKVELRWRPTGSPNAYTDEATETVTANALASGATADYLITHTLTAGGSLDFQYCVDMPPVNPGAVAESNENNNCSGDTTISVQNTVPEITFSVNSLCLANNTAPQIIMFVSNNPTSCVVRSSTGSSWNVTPVSSSNPLVTDKIATITGDTQSNMRTYTATCSNAFGSGSNSVTFGVYPSMVGVTPNPTTPAFWSTDPWANASGLVSMAWRGYKTSQNGYGMNNNGYDLYIDADTTSQQIVPFKTGEMSQGSDVNGYNIFNYSSSISGSHKYKIGVYTDSATNSAKLCQAFGPEKSIAGSAFSVSCLANPVSAPKNTVITWGSSVTGGSGSFTYSWKEGGVLTGDSSTNSSPTKTYGTDGTYTRTVTVTDTVSGDHATSPNCSVAITTPEAAFGPELCVPYGAVSKEPTAVLVPYWAPYAGASWQGGFQGPSWVPLGLTQIQWEAWRTANSCPYINDSVKYCFGETSGCGLCPSGNPNPPLTWNVPGAYYCWLSTSPSTNPSFPSPWNVWPYYWNDPGTVQTSGSQLPESPATRTVMYEVECATTVMTAVPSPYWCNSQYPEFFPYCGKYRAGETISLYAKREIDWWKEASKDAVFTATNGSQGSGIINISLSNVSWNKGGVNTSIWFLYFDKNLGGGTRFVLLEKNKSKSGTLPDGTAYTATCGTDSCSISHTGLAANSQHKYQYQLNAIYSLCPNVLSPELTVNAPSNNSTVRTLTINKLGTGGGSITSTPEGTNTVGISCGSGCTTASTQYTDGATVSLVMAPDGDSVLGAISGSCNSSQACSSFSMRANLTVNVTFDPKPVVNYPLVSCYASASGYTDPNSPVVAYTTTDVLWKATASNGTPPYTYLWAGDAPLNGQTGNSVSFKYPTLGTKNGRVTVTDSVGNTQISPPTNCSNVVNVVDPPSSGCDFALNPNPQTLNMVFINPNTASNVSNISINFPGICNDNITLSASPNSLPSAVAGGTDIPLTYKFYKHGTTDYNSTIVWADGDGYIKGLDLKISALKMIKPGSYTITLTGTSNTSPTPVVKTQTIQLNVTNVSPAYQEF